MKRVLQAVGTLTELLTTLWGEHFGTLRETEMQYLVSLASYRSDFRSVSLMNLLSVLISLKHEQVYGSSSGMHPLSCILRKKEPPNVHRYSGVVRRKSRRIVCSCGVHADLMSTRSGAFLSCAIGMKDVGNNLVDVRGWSERTH